MGKISDYTRVLVSKLTDVFVVDQTDNGTTETKSATVEQIGTAIGTLQNFADLDTSNKNLVDAINEIVSCIPIYGNAASGTIATFETSLAISLPLQNCTIEINAVETGTGTKSPSNPYTISGFTGANIHVADDETPHIIDNVTAISWQNEVGTVYGGSLDVTSGKLNVTWGASDMSTFNWSYASSDTRWYTTALKDIAVLSSSNPTFKAEQWNTHAWTGRTDGDIVCDNSGILYCETNDNVNRPKGLIIYQLKTPANYQLTPTQISAILGTNNVFTDTNGDTSVMYACSLKDYIERQ